VLREQLGTKRLRFTDEQRSRLAVKRKELGMKILRELGCVLRPGATRIWPQQVLRRSVKTGQSLWQPHA
jgi:hypothetical protein